MVSRTSNPIGLMAFALVVAACSSSGAHHAQATTPSSATTTAVVESAGRVGQTFSTGRPPTTTVVLRGGLLLLAPLAASDKPAITAMTAYDRCGGVPGHFRAGPPRVGPPVVELTRATIKDWGQVQANGSVRPIVGNRLVWIIWYRSATIPAPVGGVTVRRTRPTVHVPSFVREDIMTFVDAHSGRCLNSEVFPA